MKNKKSKIEISVELDDNKIPEKIFWSANDAGIENSETKAAFLSVWDSAKKESLRIDLWTKNMIVNDMKKFYIDILGGLSQSILNSTGDNYISNEMNPLWPP